MVRSRKTNTPGLVSLRKIKPKSKPRIKKSPVKTPSQSPRQERSKKKFVQKPKKVTFSNVDIYKSMESVPTHRMYSTGKTSPRNVKVSPKSKVKVQAKRRRSLEKKESSSPRRRSKNKNHKFRK